MKKEKKRPSIKEKVIEASGSISGAASILGSWQVCHNICLGLIAMLSVIGITLTGMPLLFLTKIAIPVWFVAIALFSITFYFYHTRRCISQKLMLMNAGLIIAGTPFQQVQKFNWLLWTVGGIFVLTAAVMFIKDKWVKK